MRNLFYCSYCKKTIEKKILKKGNTTYLPINVTHKHKGMNFLLIQIIPLEMEGY